MERVLNALSIDVEEYFQVTAFNGQAPLDQWDSYQARVHRATEKILSILEEHGTKATFFIVGWVARKHPGIVKVIQRQGHEIACHSYAHREISEQSLEVFRKDLRLARSILEDITGERVSGYRAPTFSITTDTLWALDVLIEEGFRYDSSVFPIRHDRYGMPKAERFPNVICRNNGYELLEFPMSTVRVMGMNLPFAGGGYMRLLPPGIISRAIGRINRGGQPAIVYVHPWEFDPDQPRIRASRTTSFRHYHNIGTMTSKFERLLTRHEFAPVWEVLKRCRPTVSSAAEAEADRAGAAM
jgi:polysaccharide deacetylase family protein (PEP-CTERM system associated)